jgi:integrase
MRFRIVIREKITRADGTCQVKIAVTFNHKIRYIGTDYYVIPRYFDKKTGKIKTGGTFTQEKAERANYKLQIKIGELARKVESHDVERVSINTLMATLRDSHKDIDFFSVIDSRIAKYKKDGNVNYASSMTTTRNKVKEYVGIGRLPFNKIDYNFLAGMDSLLRYREDHPDSTIGIYMRNVRTIWNQGRKMGLVDISRNPFLNYKIGKGDPRENVVLSPLEMATIAKVEIKEPLMRWSRDMAMLSFCLIGVNPKDIFLAKEISSGRIFYKRSKGKKRYSIKVRPQALHIIRRYPGKKYLLDTMDRYSSYRSATKRIDKKLKDIALLCKIEKRITLYCFRHSWSAYARFLGVSKDDIAAALGHRQIDLPIVTEWYDHVEEEQRRVDEANKKVVRFILRTKAKELPSG